MSGWILLVEDVSGSYVVGVRFPSLDDAREWEDAQGVTASGAVPIVSRREALRLHNGGGEAQ